MLLRRENLLLFFNSSHLSLLPGMDAIKIGGREAPTKCTFAEEIRGEGGGGRSWAGIYTSSPSSNPAPCIQISHAGNESTHIQFPNVKLWAKKLDLLVKKVSWAWGGKGTWLNKKWKAQYS